MLKSKWPLRETNGTVQIGTWQIKGQIENGTKSKLNGQTKDDLSTLGRSPSEKPH